MQAKVICQLCKETIAEVDIEKLHTPLSGAMFMSHDPGHGIPAPFNASHGWEEFRCPMGGHRPLIWPDKILTDKGLFTFGPDGPIGSAADPGEIGREGIYDRNFNIERPAMLSDEDAAAAVRAQMMNQPIIQPEAGVNGNGETDTREGQPEDDEPVESEEKETNKETGRTDGEREATPTDGRTCHICKATLRSNAGLVNHLRAKHGIRN